MAYIGSIVAGIGILAFVAGIALLANAAKCECSMDLDRRVFSGPVWFILVTAGFAGLFLLVQSVTTLII